MKNLKTISITILKRHPFLLVVISILFASVVSFIDALVDYWFYYEETLAEVFFPSFESHEFYMRMMLIATVTVFGFLITLLLRDNFKYLEKINKSEFMFKTVANFTKDWEYWQAVDGSLNFISPSCFEMTGYSTEEFTQNPELINSIIVKSDIDKYMAHENTDINERELEQLEFRIEKKNKEIIWIGHTCRAVYDEDGKYLGQRVSNRNISSQKKVEEKLRETSQKLEERNKLLKREVDLNYLELEAIISQSPYAKAICDKYGKIIKVNEAWNKLFSENLSYDNIQELIVDQNEELKNDVEKVIKDGGSLKSQPIYSEQLDRVLQLDVYTIKNLEGETEKIVFNYDDITDQMQMLDSDNELEFQKHVSKKMFQFLESERKHISKELHDQIGQKLMLIKLNLEIIKERTPQTSDEVDTVIKLLLNTNKEIKDIIYSLHPAELENYGLVSALESMIHRCSSMGGYSPNINIYGNYIPLKKDVELTIYRICQEITSNITKHSKATKANIEFHFDENVFTGIISDNGIGFDHQNFLANSKTIRSFGLISVQERAKILNGFLEFSSKINEGTKIYFQIPITEKKDA